MRDTTMNKKTTVRRTIRLGRWTVVLAIVWTAIIGISLAWNLHEQERVTEEVARTQARAGFEKDVLYRRWNAMHGGVYVPATDTTTPNAHLNVPERDIQTPSERALTLVNPAYMTRQVHELGAQTNGVQGHITSLDPIRPENGPDPWETAALEAFERGAPEHSSIEEFRGEPHLRLMRPLMTEKGCLKCHAAQGYQEGDVRGGISVSVPMAPLWTIARATVLSTTMWHGFFWVLGLGGIGLSYRHLRARIRERDRAEAELETTHRKLVQSARLAGMAEVATDVLHNVGNVLNSVNVSAQLLNEKVRRSLVTELAKVNVLIDQHAEDLGTFITSDERGKHLPEYLRELSRQLDGERDSMSEEADALMKNVEHIKEIVNRQQAYATTSGVTVSVSLSDLVEDALKTNDASFLRHNDTVLREYEEMPQVTTDRHKVLQILVNLISNAKQSLAAADADEKRLTLRVVRCHEDRVTVEVEDNGIGIPADNLSRIFQHGFTTKKEGHGFGLHSSALAAKELGGALTAYSEGPGEGAKFSLTLPIASAQEPDQEDKQDRTVDLSREVSTAIC